MKRAKVPAPAIDLFGQTHDFEECRHEGHKCDTLCRACGCCEHCENDCGCEVHDLPMGVRCPGDGCDCEGDGPALMRHTPERVAVDECGRCDDDGLVGGDTTRRSA